MRIVNFIWIDRMVPDTITLKLLTRDVTASPA